MNILEEQAEAKLTENKHEEFSIKHYKMNKNIEEQHVICNGLCISFKTTDTFAFFNINGGVWDEGMSFISNLNECWVLASGVFKYATFERIEISHKELIAKLIEHSVEVIK